MGYDLVTILTDHDGNPIPQYYDTVAGEFKPLTEEETEKLATRMGEVQASPTANTLLGRLKEIEDYLNSVDGKDFATQTTLAAVLAKLADLDITTLPSLPAGANAIGSVDVDNFPGTQTVDGDVEAEGKAAHDAAASGNPVQVGGVYRVADPALDDGDAGSARVNVRGELITQSAGTITEYAWGSGEVPPTPDASATGIIVGVEVDTKTIYIWNPEISSDTPEWVEWLVL